jgi:cytochrome c biogenesis protein CcmG/thiol:disulfide interchange protein DsbE
MSTTSSETEAVRPQTEAARPNTRRMVFVLLPLIGFLGMAALFLVGLNSGDPSILPSALIGKPMPKTELPPIAGLTRDGKPVPGLDAATFQGGVTLVNVWASWCVPCHDEVPFLEVLGKDKRFKLVGINYKDAAADARRFLNFYGNPFVANGADRSGRSSINWGVYGVPETYVINRKGVITYKLVGPVTQANLTDTVMPQIEKALKE